jgi:prolipoprotein diacylglyceryl transferase
MLAFITWGLDPAIFEIFGREIRWYGVLFASSFILGQFILTKFFKEENTSTKRIDSFTIYGVLGTVIGARLGHCFFYEPAYYFSNPIEIFMIHKGGLASHGAGFGLILATYLFYKKNEVPSYPWMLDKVVIIVALAGFCIRTGNFCNSEIIGVPTNSPQGVVFHHNSLNALTNSSASWITNNPGFLTDDITISASEGTTKIKDQVYQNMTISIPFNPRFSPVAPEAIGQAHVIDYLNNHIALSDQHLIFESETTPIIANNTMTINALGVPRHPSQLYEALTSLILFVFLFLNHSKFRGMHGFSFGVFMVYIFGLRFIHELLKENQVAMEDDWFLNMGQILSIPMILIGAFCIYNAVMNTRSRAN